MKKSVKLRSAAVAAVLPMALMFGKVPKSLKEIEKPYIGRYECESIFLGDEERTDRFEYINIDLEQDGKMKLIYREKNGKKGEFSAKYSYDTEKQLLTIYVQLGGVEKQKTFRVKDGKFEICVRYGEKMLIMKFVRQ